MASAEGRPVGARIRIVGLTREPVTRQAGRIVGKISPLFDALGRRFELVGVGSVSIPSLARAVLLARNVRRDREQWRIRTHLDPLTVRLRTLLAGRYLASLDGRYDVIVQCSTLFGPGPGRPHRPYVVATDNTFPLSRRYWPRWTPESPSRGTAFAELEAQVFRGASRVFTWSEFARRSVIDDIGVSDDRAIASGLGTNLFTTEIDPAKYAARIALFVGNELERKGGPVLLAAWERVRRALPGARLVIAGPRVAPVTETPGVEWLGRIRHEELRQHLQAASVFVLPSLFEPFGVAFMEAKGHGLGCIGTDVCAMPEIITDGVSGRMVAAGEVEPLAQALVEVLGDPREAERLGRASHREFFERHTWESVVRIMAPHLEAVARGG